MPVKHHGRYGLRKLSSSVNLAQQFPLPMLLSLCLGNFKCQNRKVLLSVYVGQGTYNFSPSAEFPKDGFLTLSLHFFQSSYDEKLN